VPNAVMTMETLLPLLSLKLRAATGKMRVFGFGSWLMVVTFKRKVIHLPFNAFN
jgi:hypothetical protein